MLEEVKEVEDQQTFMQKKGEIKYYFQVKVNTSRPTKKEIKRLRNMARKRGGVAVVIQKIGNKKKWKFFGNWSR